MFEFATFFGVIPIKYKTVIKTLFYETLNLDYKSASTVYEVYNSLFTNVFSRIYNTLQSQTINKCHILF